MFKKAEKEELRTWLIGDCLLTIILAVVTVILIGSLITAGFSAGKVVWGIVFALITVLFGYFLIAIIKAMVTFDERKQKREADEALAKQKEVEDNKDKIEQEMLEMENLRKEEEQKRAENLAAIEAARQEKLAAGEKFGEDDE